MHDLDELLNKRRWAPSEVTVLVDGNFAETGADFYEAMYKALPALVGWLREAEGRAERLRAALHDFTEAVDKQTVMEAAYKAHPYSRNLADESAQAIADVSQAAYNAHKLLGTKPARYVSGSEQARAALGGEARDAE
jgi:hypothetical protein